MIRLSNFNAQLNSTEIDSVMESACEIALNNPVSLYRFIHRFVFYAKTYSTAVPSLCSAIGASRFFQDPSCSFSPHSGRSMDVASKVFSASVEEFCDPKTGVSHRTLSYGLLDTLAEYANLSVDEVNTISQSGHWLLDIVNDVQTIYSPDSDDLAALIRAMGFHAAAETIGENECRIIDSMIFRNRQDRSFRDFIRNRKIKFKDVAVSPWYWIVIHGAEGTHGLEVEHSADAIEALNRAVAYTTESEEQIIAWASQGFAQFASIQKAFFAQAKQEIQAVSTLAAA